MTHRLTFRPALTLKGRKFFGPLRGWAGKPVHPPLTDVPIAAYVIAAAFDVISAIWKSASWSQDRFSTAHRSCRSRRRPVKVSTTCAPRSPT